MKTEVFNLDSKIAYQSLCYLASRHKVTTDSSKVHSRRLTFKNNVDENKAGEKIDVWYVRAHDDEQKYYLAVPVGKPMTEGFKCKPEDVDLKKVQNITVNKQKYHLVEQENFGQFVPNE